MNSTIVNMCIFIILIIITNHNDQVKTHILKQKLSVVSFINFKFQQNNNKVFCKFYIYYLTYYVFFYLIRILYINFIHLLIINNLYIFIDSETILSKIVNDINLFYFNRKYYFHLCKLSIIKNTGILETNIESIKNFGVGMKCKYYNSNNVITIYYKYYLKNFFIQILQSKIKI